MRVALYVRVSTEEQAVHGLSIDAQLAALNEWAKPHTVVDRYIDAGVSGRTSLAKRPQLSRLLSDVKAGAIDCVVFTKLDRWTRNIREYYKAQDVLDAHNVSWRAIHEDYETETASGRLKVNIMLSVAQDEADRTSERIKAVFAEKRKRGETISGNAAVGTKIVDKKVVVGDDAERVREMYRAFIASRSAREVAKKVGLTTGGAKYALKNHLYVDLGIIDQQTYDTAQAIMAARSQRRGRTDREYLFSGIMKCPECGGRMAVLYSYHTVYYRCGRYERASKCLYNRCIREDATEEWLLTHIMDAVKDVNVSVREKQKAPIPIEPIRRRMDKLTDLYMDDLISKAKYENEYRDLQTQLFEAQRQPKPIDETEVMTALDAYGSLSRKAQKAFWSYLIKRLVPSEEGFNVTLTFVK